MALEVPRGSWGVLGGYWDVLGAVLGSRDDPEDMGAHSRVSWEASRSVKKLSRTVFVKIMESK